MTSSDIAGDLIRKAERREALFGIVGLGYVGLPLAVELANAGYAYSGSTCSRRSWTGSTPEHRTSRTSRTPSSRRW